MENLIAIDKALNFIQKARVSCQVRKTHLERQAVIKRLKEELGRTPDEEEILEAMNGKGEGYINDPLISELKDKTLDLEKWLNKQVEKIVKNHPAYPWFSRIKGIGGLNIGKVICLIEIEKCQNISQLWRYALGAPINGKIERRTKGEHLHYNILLKTMCWRLGKSLIKANGNYAKYYRLEKTKIIKRFEAEGFQVVPADQLPKENGKKVETDGKISLGHADNMAMRKMIKLFLSHLWLKWRESLGLPITRPYIHAIGGHDGYINPDEMIDR